MAKVLCERPRGGARLKRRSRFRGPIEEAPRFESTSRRRGGSKWLGEHLGPLRRWLRAQAGRPWDAVYSELRANISPRNAVQMHIWQHAQRYVARHVDVIRGRPYHRPGSSHRFGSTHRTDIPLSHLQYPVYVCPKTGLLEKTPVRARERRRAA